MNRKYVMGLLLAAAVGGLAAFFLLRGAAHQDQADSAGTTSPGGRLPGGAMAVKNHPSPEGVRRSGDIRAALARFADAKIPLDERRKEIAELARKADARSLELLMALGDELTYLNRTAVEELGSAQAASAEQKAKVAAYLEAKLAADDALLICAAVRALGRLEGEAAVPELLAVIQANHERPDGHQEMVCSAAVEMLRDIGSLQGVAGLIAELARSGEKGWSLEYGSKLLAALLRADTPEGRAAALAYAARLAAQLPKDAMARKYYEAKISEARAAAEGRTSAGM